MHRAVLRSVRAIYEALPPELAQDESPAMALANEMRRLARKWLGRFEEEGPKQARRFAREAQRSTDASMAARLRDQGFSVQFKVTAEMNDAYQAVVAENVGLIRSIAEQHLQRVQGSVMRSVSTGRDLETLAKDIEKRYRLTRKRAGFIARDQNNKATAVITRVRQEGLGITHARWRHSRAGKQPRKSHLQADGEIYEVARGMFLDGKWIRPGEEPNCRCVSQSIIPGFE
ncbi:phage head morphogenesis protein [Bordetella sp. 02P26C-1]|nr:phage head morphogenesis protein [Bordetella sp. 02P26C-1]